MSNFDSPDPSLCDTCKNAYIVPGGSIGMFNLDGTGKHCRQRYCSTAGSAADGVREPGVFQSISLKGFDECPKYEKKEENGNS